MKVFLIGAMVLALTACSPENVKEDPKDAPVQVTNPKPDTSQPPVEDVIQVDVDVLASLIPDVTAEYSGGMLSTHFEVDNISENAISVTFPSGQRYDYQILDGSGEILYTWSMDKSFIEMLMDETIEPGQSWLYDEQLSLSDLEFKAGEYSVVYTMSFYVNGEMYALSETALFTVE